MANLPAGNSNNHSSIFNNGSLVELKCDVCDNVMGYTEELNTDYTMCISCAFAAHTIEHHILNVSLDKKLHTQHMRHAHYARIQIGQNSLKNTVGNVICGLHYLLNSIRNKI